jgi:hypothetical protein
MVRLGYLHQFEKLRIPTCTVVKCNFVFGLRVLGKSAKVPVPVSSTTVVVVVAITMELFECYVFSIIVLHPEP